MPDFFSKKTYDYSLPEELIAQVPVEPRDHCRLLSVSKETGALTDCRFDQLAQFLKKGDLLVRNNTRVMPARLNGIRESSGGKCEILLLKPLSQPHCWEGLVRPGKKLKPGSFVRFGAHRVMVGEQLTSDGKRMIHFSDQVDPQTLMKEYGELPLPPYIHDRSSDDEDYQTIYSKDEKSAAAPTAGLHFTHQLFEQLKQLGVQVMDLTLEVGLGTFRPLSQDNILDHVMHEERCFVPQQLWEQIKETHDNGGRIVAVGTTVVRTLEALASGHGQPGQWFATDLFIYPGYTFQVVDALITNFHLPESTLLMLVSAFCGYEKTMEAYRYAVEQKYRFFSFGDAMIIH